MRCMKYIYPFGLNRCQWSLNLKKNNESHIYVSNRPLSFSSSSFLFQKLKGLLPNFISSSTTEKSSDNLAKLPSNSSDTTTTTTIISTSSSSAPSSKNINVTKDLSPSADDPNSYFINPGYHSPRYPIVLCHGLFGFDKMGSDFLPLFQIHYWRGISEALRGIGCKVFEAKVPSTGSISQRALALKAYVEAHELTHLNFVAHSMGGLDCRYLISKLNPTFYVHSLTTISTPHRGSPFMDWCSTTFGIGKSTPLPRTPFTWFDFPAYANLTTTYCRSVFNVEILDQPSTQYYSYGAHYRIPFWSPLWFPSEIIKAKEGENDGLVSVASARWGIYLDTLPTDHWGVNNRWFSSKINSQFDALEFYMQTANRLWKAGF